MRKTAVISNKQGKIAEDQTQMIIYGWYIFIGTTEICRQYCIVTGNYRVLSFVEM
jgi:hypothetical protein